MGLLSIWISCIWVGLMGGRVLQLSYTGVVGGSVEVLVANLETAGIHAGVAGCFESIVLDGDILFSFP